MPKTIPDTSPIRGKYIYRVFGTTLSVQRIGHSAGMLVGSKQDASYIVVSVIITLQLRNFCRALARRYAERDKFLICYANNPSVSLSVRPSVTRVNCIKTAERIIEILSPSDRTIILVFFFANSCCVSLTASPLIGGRIQRGGDF